MLSMELILYADYSIIPEYIFDNIHNNSKYVSKIIILTNNIEELKKAKDLHFYNNIEIVDLNIYKSCFLSRNDIIKISIFRDGFWLKTINRYFEIYNYIEKNNKKNIFHIENDVLIFTPLQDIYNFLIKDKNKIYVCKDSPHRALGSMVFIPDNESLKKLCDFFIKKIKESLLENIFYNDMQLLGMYEDCNSFSTSPDINGIVDACCFGQCLGGVDKRNIEGNTVGFINESSVFKPELIKINKINNQWYYELCKLHTLHIHSKELHKYTNIFISSSLDDVLQVNRFTKYKEFMYINSKEPCDSIYIKTDFINDFVNNYLHLIKYPVDLYFGNCDKSFHSYKVCDNQYVNKVYAMNPCIFHNKIIFEPIGIANDSWSHGNKEILYDIILKTKKWKKTKGVFYSFNENTFPYRRILKKELENNNIKNIKYNTQEDFWNEMSQHKYVLCPRGNGFDTHRFYEATWLGCVPIIINNKHTEENYNIFVSYLRQNYNFIEIKEDEISEIIKKIKELE